MKACGRQSPPWRRSVVAVFLVTSSLSTHVDGQAQGRTDGIAPDVVLALNALRLLSRPNIELHAGPPPSGFPMDVFPHDVEFGAWLAEGGRGTTVVVRAPLFDVSALNTLQATLAAAGWVSLQPRMGGFTMAPPSSLLLLCRGLDFVTLTAAVRTDGGSFLAASLTKESGRACVAPPIGASMMASLPPLRPPKEVRMTGGGGAGGGQDLVTAQTRLETSMDVEELASFFEDQLRAAGWKQTGHSRQPGFTLLRFAVALPSGAATGYLTVLTVGDGKFRDAFVRLTSNERPAAVGSTPPTAGATLQRLPGTVSGR